MKVAIVFALLFACVEGRREQVKVHDASGNYPQDVGGELAETLDTLYKTFSARTNKRAADSIVFNIRRVAKRYEYGNGRTINEEGWNLMIKEIGLQPKDDLEKEAMKQAWTYLSEGVGSLDPFVASQKLTNGQMSARRINVLSSIYASLAGGTTKQLTEEQLTCSKHKATLIEAMGGAPVTFEKFKAYYNELGMFIADDGHFELMLVNAWHHMKPPYDEVNTANLRMRCYMDDLDDEGKYLVLINDCQQGRLEDLVYAQTGVQYKKCLKHE